mgnify:CR=1 FL=1
MTKQTQHIAFLCSIITTGILWIHAQIYAHFLSDDALISMRYAQRLLEGKGLTWTDGIPVEGYSNLLWVLLTAALGACGMDLVDAVRLLGFICNASVIFALLYLFINYSKDGNTQTPALKVFKVFKVFKVQKSTPQTSIIPLAIAQLFWVLSGSTAVWSMGGLEQPLVAAGIAWAVVLFIPALNALEVDFKQLLLASIGLTIVVLTRPDGPLFTACLCVVWWLVRPKTRLNFIAGCLLAALPFCSFLGQMLFRIVYYHDFVPNTAHVKVVFSNSRVLLGTRYVLEALGTTSPFFEFIIIGCGLAFYKKRNRATLYAILMPAAAWLIYIGSVGGDIFPAFRHGLLVYGLMSVCLLFLMKQAMPALDLHAPRWLQWCLIALCFTPFLIMQIEHSANKEAFYERWEWDGQAVGRTLGAAFEEQQPLYAITAAGALPYWSQLPVLDMLGLNDYYIARNPPPNFGEGELGHDLGDGHYVLQQAPAIISFCSPYGRQKPCRLSGQQMVKTQEFKDFYVPMYIAIKPLNGRAAFTNIQWVRWQDSPIGVTTQDQTLTIPAYLGAQSASLAAKLNGQNQLFVKLAPGAAIKLPLTAEFIDTNNFDPTNSKITLESNEQLSPNAANLTVSLDTGSRPQRLVLKNKSNRSIKLISVQLSAQKKTS